MMLAHCDVTSDFITRNYEETNLINLLIIIFSGLLYIFILYYIIINGLFVEQKSENKSFAYFCLLSGNEMFGECCVGFDAYKEYNNKYSEFRLRSLLLFKNIFGLKFEKILSEKPNMSSAFMFYISLLLVYCWYFIMLYSVSDMNNGLIIASVGFYLYWMIFYVICWLQWRSIEDSGSIILNFFNGGNNYLKYMATINHVRETYFIFVILLFVLAIIVSYSISNNGFILYLDTSGNLVGYDCMPNSKMVKFVENNGCIKLYIKVGDKLTSCNEISQNGICIEFSLTDIKIKDQSIVGRGYIPYTVTYSVFNDGIKTKDIFNLKRIYSNEKYQSILQVAKDNADPNKIVS